MEGSIWATYILIPDHQVMLGGPNKSLRLPGWGLVIRCGEGGLQIFAVRFSVECNLTGWLVEVIY